jgi:hypothetical protein
MFSYLHACNAIVVAGQVIEDDEVAPLNELRQHVLVQQAQVLRRSHVQRFAEPGAFRRSTGTVRRCFTRSGSGEEVSEDDRHRRLRQVRQPLDQGHDGVARPIGGNVLSRF